MGSSGSLRSSSMLGNKAVNHTQVVMLAAKTLSGVAIISAELMPQYLRANKLRCTEDYLMVWSVPELGLGPLATSTQHNFQPIALNMKNRQIHKS